tara:strand:- start:13132 stop:13521 length:390 start_codon:yes stop_codon:yes gene_type:complete
MPRKKADPLTHKRAIKIVFELLDESSFPKASVSKNKFVAKQISIAKKLLAQETLDYWLSFSTKDKITCLSYFLCDRGKKEINKKDSFDKFAALQDKNKKKKKKIVIGEKIGEDKEVKVYPKTIKDFLHL